MYMCIMGLCIMGIWKSCGSSYLAYNKLYQLYIKLHMYPMNIHIKFVFKDIYIWNI
jgi:hypothetical protein